jgi:hypothetical protein
LVESELQPLLPTTPSEASALPPQTVVEVNDHGDDYDVTVGDQHKVFTDHARNCVERARVAAVFVALNLPEHPLEPIASSSPAESASPSVVAKPRRTTSLAIGSLARLSTASNQWMLGGSLWARLQHRAVSAGVELSADSPLEQRDPTSGVVQSTLTRLASQVRLGVLWREPYLSAGPFLGTSFELWLFRGQNLLQDASPIRPQLGLALGAEAMIGSTPGFSFYVQAAAIYYPFRYDIATLPSGVFAQTPQIWLGFSLGVANSMWL